MTNQNFQSLDMDYFKQIAERRNKRIESERAEALRKKNEPKQETPKEQEEKTIRMPESAESRKDYVFVPSLGLYLSENRYLQDKDWNQTQDILHKEGRRMPTIPEFIEFSKYLKSKEGKTKVKNSEKILDEIYTVRSPYRAEWLDANFKVKSGKLYVNYHVFENNKIVQKTEQLEECLMQDKEPGIDLESWLSNSTKQGLPKPNCKDGKLYYWFPRSDNNSVAGFGANSGGAYLDCLGNPDIRLAGLGVRYVEARSAETASGNDKSQFGAWISKIASKKSPEAKLLKI